MPPATDAQTDTAIDTPADRFRRVAGTLTQLATQLDAHDWDRPVPCEGWVARDIVRHLVEWVPAVIGRSGLAMPDATVDHAHPVHAWVALADSLQAALDDPKVASRRFDAGPPGELSLESAIDMLVVGDVLVHTWDLATASGRPAELDQQIAAEMLAGMEPIDELLRSSGHYGPRTDVPDDADVITRLIAFTGRDPEWSSTA